MVSRLFLHTVLLALLMLARPSTSLAGTCESFLSPVKSDVLRSLDLENVAVGLLGKLLLQNDRHLPSSCKGGTCVSVSIANVILVLAEALNPGIISERSFTRYDLRISTRPFEDLSVMGVHKAIMNELMPLVSKKLTLLGDARKGAYTERSQLVDVIRIAYEKFFGDLPLDLKFHALDHSLLADSQAGVHSQGVYFLSLKNSQKSRFLRRSQYWNHALFMLGRNTNQERFLLFDPMDVNYPVLANFRLTPGSKESGQKFETILGSVSFGRRSDGLPIEGSINHIIAISFMPERPPLDRTNLARELDPEGRRGTLTLRDGVQFRDVMISYKPIDGFVRVQTDSKSYAFSPSKVYSIDMNQQQH